MTVKIDLLFFGNSETRVRWSLGSAMSLPANPADAAQAIGEWLRDTTAEFALFWDATLGQPDENRMIALAARPGDVFHAGLRLGLGNTPSAVDFVRPTWMFNCDAPASIESTSWRVSMRACLARTDVIRQLGSVDASFDTLDAAALDMGHRYLANGAVVRHVPEFVSANADPRPASITYHDEFRFVRNQYGRRWMYWSAFRALANQWAPLEVASAVVRVATSAATPTPAPYQSRTTMAATKPSHWHDRISILIPTLERYSYLRNELLQLREQTIRPKDIVIVDQTNPPDEAKAIRDEFADLPIRYIHQTTTGQCTAWNAALQAAGGDYLLFLGDDADRLTPDFLERFAARFDRSQADMVASVVEEVGAGGPPESCRFLRVSDIFPIAMIKREVLRTTGLMDFAYDRAKRADGDLAMRCYLAGALMILDPAISPLHHRAPRGGLRKHGVRVVTRATSRQVIRQRHLPSASEIYLAMRYFAPQHLREELWIQTVSSLSGGKSRAQRLLKLLYGLYKLPNSVSQIRGEREAAQAMLKQFPQIPTFQRERDRASAGEAVEMSC
jgi:glycosyltransferase involved in cell wall biosynthesis